MLADQFIDFSSVLHRILAVRAHVHRGVPIVDPRVMLVYVALRSVTQAFLLPLRRDHLLVLLDARAIVPPSLRRLEESTREVVTYGQAASHDYIDVTLRDGKRSLCR